jgi:hypothetical protein
MQTKWQSTGHSENVLVQAEKLQNYDNHHDYTNDVKDVVHDPSEKIRIQAAIRATTNYRGIATVKLYIQCE